MGEASRTDPVEAAAKGAFWATALAIFAMLFIAFLVFVVVLKPWAGNGSGMITNPTVALMAFVILAIVGPIAGVIGGMLAGVGAKFGGKLGRVWACRCAALMSAFWVVATPFLFLMGLISAPKHDHSRRHSVLDLPHKVCSSVLCRPLVVTKTDASAVLGIGTFFLADALVKRSPLHHGAKASVRKALS